MRVIRLEPVDGFCAQTMAAAVIQGATQLSQPVSTTHVVSGAVMGREPRVVSVRCDGVWRATSWSPGLTVGPNVSSLGFSSTFRLLRP
jgi:phosphate/sulfate permease